MPKNKPDGTTLDGLLKIVEHRRDYHRERSTRDDWREVEIRSIHRENAELLDWVIDYLKNLDVVDRQVAEELARKIENRDRITNFHAQKGPPLSRFNRKKSS